MNEPKQLGEASLAGAGVRTGRQLWRAFWGPSTLPDKLSLLLLIAYSCLCVSLLDDYGLTYDEPTHVLYGDLILEYFTSGGEQDRALTYDRYYGGGFDLFAAIVRWALPLSKYAATHLASLACGIAALVGAWALARTVRGPLAGLFALAALALTPVFFGHQFNNMKDIPFAGGYVWALFFLTRAARQLPQVRWRTWFGFGVCAGLAMSVRVAGLVLLAYSLAILLAAAAQARWLRGPPWSLGEWRRSAVAALCAGAFAWLLMVLPWPWALGAPLSRPLASLSRFSNYQKFTSTTLLHGETVSSRQAPWDYLPSYLSFQLPELVVVLGWLALPVGLALCVRAVRNKSALPVGLGLVLVAAVFPPVYAICKGSTVYDGLRQFLFVVPVLCVLAAATAIEIWQWLQAKSPALPAVARRALYALVGVLGLTTVAVQGQAMLRTHPYQHMYFNHLTPGREVLGERYETEYYGTTYKELHRWLKSYVYERDGEASLNKIYTVTGCGTHWFFRWYLPANFRYVSRKKARQADFYSTYRRYGCHQQHTGKPLLYQLEREGVVLATIRDMKAPSKARGGRRK